MTANSVAVGDPRERARMRREDEGSWWAPDRVRMPRPGWAQPGRLVVGHVPALATHTGTPPDLVLQWNSMPRSTTVDVVLHLHGHSPRGRDMDLVRDIEPVSGLDFADPASPGGPARSTPTLLVLPRGHFYGGRSGRGYSFPALQRPGALAALVADALRRFAAASGVNPTRGRLILTAHSGGGASLMAILRHMDPDEVHTFDALYGDPGPLIAWARRRQATGRGAMRVLFRPGEPTAAHSLRVESAVPRSPTFRVEETRVAHMAIPRTYGWRLLADPAADLPGARRPAAPSSTGPRQGQLRELPSRQGLSPSSPPLGEALCQSMARIAREQYLRWRPYGGAALVETSAAAAPILREYYRLGTEDTVTEAQMRSSPYQASHPWSAVFISYVARRAGAGTAFCYSRSHQRYIKAARRNRLTGNTGNPFWAYRVTEVAPGIGDLVCASRQGSGATYDNIADRQIRPTHCDVVVEVQPRRVRVIGGNVGQSVGEKWLRTLPDGRLDTSGTQSRFFAVIRCRQQQGVPQRGAGQQTAPRRAAGTAPAPAPSGSSGPTPADLDARIMRVMELLVGRYRYPVNGAAGLVGNLIEESTVLPNRIEGSRASTPMRAPDFSGRVRDFTPDEVQNRDFRRRIGPAHPGVGLAQWTSAARRAGLFRHAFHGRVRGSAILTDLDAQVDYLVSELRGSYPAVHAAVTSPGVTLENASDAVVLRFEVPAAVLNRPVSDPGVQQVLARRRAAGAHALGIYRASHP